jgi:hypothetical protein
MTDLIKLRQEAAQLSSGSFILGEYGDPFDLVYARDVRGTLTGAAADFSFGPDVKLAGMHDLIRDLERLEERIAALEQAINIIDEPDLDEATGKARSYFDSNPGRPIYPDELAAAIGTSVSQAIEICEILEKEGSIAAR